MNSHDNMASTTHTFRSLGEQVDRAIDTGRKATLISLGLVGLVIDRSKEVVELAEKRGTQAEREINRLRRKTEAHLMARGADLEREIRMVKDKWRTKEQADATVAVDISVATDVDNVPAVNATVTPNVPGDRPLTSDT